MFRFITFLLGREYEECKSCDTLKKQLAFSQAEKRELLDTILGIVKPKIIEAPVQELQPVIQTAGLFSRRRAAAEQRDRETARVIENSKLIGRTDGDKSKLSQMMSTEELEQSLAVGDEK